LVVARWSGLSAVFLVNALLVLCAAPIALVNRAEAIHVALR
jgi:hypothetical protein